jgi:hypothetical protein
VKKQNFAKSLFPIWAERLCIPRLRGGSKFVPPLGKFQMFSVLPSISPSYKMFALSLKTIAINLTFLLST